MKALAKATGPAFDHLFLTGMIQHHTGALMMVEDLFDTPGAGQDNVLFDFATDIDNTQRAEIKIMQGMLQRRKNDRRTNFPAFAQCVTIALALSAAFRCSAPGRPAANQRPRARQPRFCRIRARRPTIRASDSRPACTTPAKRRSAWSGWSACRSRRASPRR